MRQLPYSQDFKLYDNGVRRTFIPDRGNPATVTEDCPAKSQARVKRRANIHLKLHNGHWAKRKDAQ